MRTFVFRNQTVEPFLGETGITYSGYGDISVIPDDVDRYIWFYQVPVNADSRQLSQEVASYGDQLELVLSRIDGNVPFVIFSLENLFPMRLTGDDTAVNEAIAAFNSRAMAWSHQRPGVKWVDFSEFTSRYDSEALVNWKFHLISQSLLNPKLSRDFKAWWQRIEDEMALRRKKCLVLDLDNTLWGGVLGEDGVAGIALGGDYPGKAYSYWQSSLLQLSRTGVILAVCSKNNEADVQEAWDNHPAMVLKREHFSALRINWQDKATNLNDLARELNIGLDSMVFLDDNPAERELVRQLLPQVVVPDFPEKPYQLMPFFKELVEKYFRIYAITDEDRTKNEQYLANAKRQAEQSRFADMEDFLYSLDISIDVMPADDLNLPRIAQMTQKTNQFNLTTRRRVESEVKHCVDQGWHIYCMSARDRFGDQGITGTIFLEPKDSLTLSIDTLLLSCRILGKGIEEAFFKTVLNLMRLDGYRNLTAEYIPTAKNSQTADFYDRMGMECTAVDDDGTKHYLMRLENVFDIKNYYNVRVL